MPRGQGDVHRARSDEQLRPAAPAAQKALSLGHLAFPLECAKEERGIRQGGDPQLGLEGQVAIERRAGVRGDRTCTLLPRAHDTETHAHGRAIG